MKNIIEYIVVENEETDCLASRVSLLISKGFQPYFGAFTNGVKFCQTMVKYDDGVKPTEEQRTMWD